MRAPHALPRRRPHSKAGCCRMGATAISGTLLGKTLRWLVSTPSGHHGKPHSGQAWARRRPWDSYPAAPAWPAAGESVSSSAEQETCQSFTSRDTNKERQATQTSATSIQPGARWRKTALSTPRRGGRVRSLLHLLLGSLLLLHPYHPKPAPSPRGFPPRNSVGLWGRDP